MDISSAVYIHCTVHVLVCYYLYTKKNTSAVQCYTIKLRAVRSIMVIPPPFMSLCIIPCIYMTSYTLLSPHQACYMLTSTSCYVIFAACAFIRDGDICPFINHPGLVHIYVHIADSTSIIIIMSSLSIQTTDQLSPW